MAEWASSEFWQLDRVATPSAWPLFVRGGQRLGLYDFKNYVDALEAERDCYRKALEEIAGLLLTNVPDDVYQNLWKGELLNAVKIARAVLVDESRRCYCASGTS